MPQITVGGLTFCNPDLTYPELRQLTPPTLVQRIIAMNPIIARSSFTKDVIMGSYEHLIADNRAKAIASGSKPRSRRTMRKKIRGWLLNAYWHSQHTRDLGFVKPPPAVGISVPTKKSHVRRQSRMSFNKVQYSLPVIATADLRGLRPATLMSLLLQENTSFPVHHFTKAMVLAGYVQLIRQAYGKAAGLGSLKQPYIHWIRSWKADGYWDHQHLQDTGLGQLWPAISQSTSQQSDSDGSPDDSDRHRAQTVSSVVHEELQQQSSLPPPSSLRFAPPPEVQRPSFLSVSSMGSHPLSPLMNPPGSPGASRPLLPIQVDMAIRRAAMLVSTQAMLPEQIPPIPHPLPARPATHFIGDEMYLLPDSHKFFLHKIDIKSFSIELLKINREVDVQKMTAEVLLECYQTFINRFFPMARNGLKANVLNCVSISDTLQASQQFISLQVTSNRNQQFLSQHTDTLARLASQPASTVPVITSSTAAVDRKPNIHNPASDTDPDVEIIEVRVLRPSISDQDAAMQQVDAAVAEDSKEREYRERKRRSQATGDTSPASERTLPQHNHPPAQLLVDNKLYTMPKTTQFQLGNLNITSFSRALYDLNGHYHPRDLSHSMILKAYKSFIFSQYLQASFDDKITACRQLNWPTPPKAEAEYLRNLNILERTHNKVLTERTHNKVLTGRAPTSATVEAEAAAPAPAVGSRIGDNEDAALIVTPSPEPRRAKPLKMSAKAIPNKEVVEAPLVRKRKQPTEGDKSHSRHKKQRRATEAFPVPAGTWKFMSGALAFRPSPVPAALSAETADGSAHRRKKKTHKTRKEAS